ncbi:MAG: Zn-dependent hydrolase, partial [Acidobacteria bacterium]|nr:Zn-dependent hydrolase [Acidobacteriota bacterium]
FGATQNGGTTRVAFSDEDLAARAFVAELMENAGLSVSIDGIGNLIGRRAGTEASLLPIMLGSHIDTVPAGGSYDGQVGSIGALEVAQTLADHGITTRHPLEFVIFQNEEGGKTGSRALIGIVEARELDVVTASGYSIGEGIRILGGDPTRVAAVERAPGSIAAFLELHIEQGAILHRQGIDIGVVEGIVGIKRWDVTFEGFANHAGTTPMNARRDALLAAARFIDAVHDVASTTSGRQVATVGRIAASPGAPNVIPGLVTVSLEIRDLEMSVIDAVFEAIRARAVAIASATDTSVDFEPFYVSHEAPTDPRIRALVAEAAEALGLSSLALPSGAGHDAQSIAMLAPIGMIFVPSIDGISHSPREYSEPDAIVAGVNVLLHTLLKLDERDLIR